jgi:predicted small secreted protein
MGAIFNHKPHPIMIQQHKRIIILLIASALFSMFTSSCGTVRGIGQDISGAGRGLQKAAS